MFVEPTWIEGALYYAAWIIIPLIIAIIMGVVIFIKDDKLSNRQQLIIGGVGFIFLVLAVCGGLFLADWGWHYQYEEPSVQTKTITVDDWQPGFGRYWGDVNSADDLMLKTSDGELFGNTENFLFGKFNTRDVLNQLKPNGTYEITYYGWREGYNNGIPNILTVDKVINETNSPTHHDISDYMNKRSIIYDDNYN